MVPPPQSCHRQRGRLKPTWAPKGAIQCRIAVAAMSCGQTPRRRHDESHRIRWRLREQTARRLRRGFLWPRGNRGTPRCSMTSSRGAWRCKRGRGHSLAVRTNRNAGIRIAPKPCSRPLSDNRHARAAALDGKRKGVKGTLAAPAAAPPVSRKRGDGSPITTQLPHARPGRATRARGAVDRASRQLARTWLARAVAMPCRVACGWRAQAGAAPASSHRPSNAITSKIGRWAVRLR